MFKVLEHKHSKPALNLFMKYQGFKEPQNSVLKFTYTVDGIVNLGISWWQVYSTYRYEINEWPVNFTSNKMINFIRPFDGY